MVKQLLLLSIMAISLPCTGFTQMCIPGWYQSSQYIYNPCVGATPSNYCANYIDKGVQYAVLYPDSYVDYKYLEAHGQSRCGYTCWPGNVVGAPFKHKECWPIFYTPTTSTGYFSAAASNVSALPVMDWCSTKGITIAYPVEIACSGPQGSVIRVDSSHACNNCDADHDGFTSTACGGDDCVDYYAWIHPGAPLVCYPGAYIDANCNGVLDEYECGSPIVIDTEGDGIEMTSRVDGVMFDLYADGRPGLISWTAPGVDDAWLSLDRNSNGAIDNGSELFGSSTPQPSLPHGCMANGFAALEVFDKAENGGNENGVIDAGDSIYSRLLLWRDINHNGISEQNELRHLTSYGISEIGLAYKKSPRVDEYGNQFRYRAKVKSLESIGKWAWDVILIR